MQNPSDFISNTNILSNARMVLEQQAEALSQIAHSLNQSFEDSVQAMLVCRGRIILTGIGKSALVAQKIVATFNSTGTPALFMHAGDALHGDLGMIQPDDLVICLSKSGNTPEIKLLVPLIKRTSAVLIALVCQKDSFLARQANFVLHTPIESEACPHNLAPTTSTTAAMALGDAIAICLLKYRNFSTQDFAYFHPGGSLGKRLYMRVQDMIVTHQTPKNSPEDSIIQVIASISSGRLGASLIVDAQNVLVGIITDGDIRRMLEKNTNLEGIKALHIMHPNPKTILCQAYASAALDSMQTHQINQLAVISADNQALGIIHIQDLLREGIV